jgi:hypothetical protein
MHGSDGAGMARHQINLSLSGNADALQPKG